MPKPLVPALLAGSLILLAAAPQKRVSKEEPTFEACLEGAASAWEAEDFATCVAEMKAGLALAIDRQAAALLAAFPPAPDGWSAMEKDRASMRNNPLAAAMASGVGNVVERSYRRPESGQRLELTLTADSPLVSMFGMMLNNPAMVEADGGELIQYEAHRGVLKETGQGLRLQVLLWGKHVLEANLRGGDDELLFSILDQAAVDRIAGQLSR